MYPKLLFLAWSAIKCLAASAIVIVFMALLIVTFAVVMAIDWIAPGATPTINVYGDEP